MEYSDIRFPHLGIVFSHVGRSIKVGNFEIMYYGIVIACAFLVGLFIVRQEARRTGQDPELYLDFLLYLVIPAIIGARLYYVIFSWDYYKAHPLEIFNLRQGGLGIVGGVAAGFIVLYLLAKKRNQSKLLMLDTIIMGLLAGQIIGRWGNFFNREAFGGYTDGLFAMQIPVNYFAAAGRLPELEQAGLLNHLVDIQVNGVTLSYIQVHPTFLYEGMLNLAILLIIFFRRKHKKFDGELLYIYMIGYGAGRFLIEGLRTDQLQIGHTGIAATQVVCILLLLGGIWGMIQGRRHMVKENKNTNPSQTKDS